MQSPGPKFAESNDEKLMTMNVEQQMNLGENSIPPATRIPVPSATQWETTSVRYGERPSLDLKRASIDRYNMPTAMSASQSVNDQKPESEDQKEAEPTLVEKAKTTMENGGAAVTNALTSVWKGVTGLVSGSGKDQDDKVEEPPTTNQGPNVNQASPTTSQASDSAVNQAIETEDEKQASKSKGGWWKPQNFVKSLNPFGTSEKTPVQPADSMKPAPAARVSDAQSEEPKLLETQTEAAPTKTKGGWFSPFSNALGGMKEKLQNLTGKAEEAEKQEPDNESVATQTKPADGLKNTESAVVSPIARRRLCVGYTNDGVCPLGNDASSTNMCTPCYNSLNRRQL